MTSERQPRERRARTCDRVAARPQPGRQALVMLATTLAATLTLLLLLVLFAAGPAAAAPAGTSAQTAAGGRSEPAATSRNVVIFDRRKYFEVHLNVAGVTAYDLGYQYGEAVMKAMPDFEFWAWTYLTAAGMFLIEYDTCLARANVLRANLPVNIQQNIRGMAAAIKKEGLGLINENDCFVMTLFPDVARGTQCSALGAWGTRTPDGEPVVGRILDWTTSILPRLNAVTVFHNGDQSFCSIGFLGGWMIISGFNKAGVFGAILDAPTGQPYPRDLTDRYSYPVDLRIALESATDIKDAATYLQAPNKYCFSHSILFGDKQSVAILENDLTGTGLYARQLRTDVTPLAKDITWGFKDAVCAVNSFVAKGNETGSFKDKWNTDRWNAYRAIVGSNGTQISWDTLKMMLGNGGPKEKTMPYNFQSVQMMVYKPTTGALEVAFCGRGEDLPDRPDWQPVKVDFSDKVFDSE